MSQSEPMSPWTSSGKQGWPVDDSQHTTSARSFRTPFGSASTHLLQPLVSHSTPGSGQPASAGPDILHKMLSSGPTLDTTPGAVPRAPGAHPGEGASAAVQAHGGLGSGPAHHVLEDPEAGPLAGSSPAMSRHTQLWHFICTHKLAIAKFLAFFGVLATLATVAGVSQGFVRSFLQMNHDLVADHLAASTFILIPAFCIASMLLIPSSLLTIFIGFVFVAAVGTIYGLLLGLVVVEVGGTVGALISFFLTRTVLHSSVTAFISARPRLNHLYESLCRCAVLGVFLMRLSPVIPFNFFNYLLGLIPITPFQAVWTTALGILPGTVVFLYIGASAAGLMEVLSSSRSITPVEYALFTLGIVVTAIVFGLSIIWSRRQLRAYDMMGGEPTKNDVFLDTSPASEPDVHQGNPGVIPPGLGVVGLGEARAGPAPVVDA